MLAGSGDLIYLFIYTDFDLSQYSWEYIGRLTIYNYILGTDNAVPVGPTDICIVAIDLVVGISSQARAKLE